ALGELAGARALPVDGEQRLLAVLGFATGVAPGGAPVLGAVGDLARGGDAQPRLELRRSLPAEAVEVLQHVATHRLGEVGRRLLAAEHGPAAQPDVGAKPREVPGDQFAHRVLVAAGRAG